MMQHCVESNGGKLRLCFLPPYSPELNPDEQVWHGLKSNGLGRSEVMDADDWERKVAQQLERLKGLPMKVRSSFQLPMTRYAAD